MKPSQPDSRPTPPTPPDRKRPTRTIRAKNTGGAPAAAKPPRKKTTAQLKLVQAIRAILEDKQGDNIVTLNVGKLSNVTDYMILCTGRNPPHLGSLADEVMTRLRKLTPPVACYRRAGSPLSQWIVLDYLDVVVHLFTAELREFYALEQLWKDAPTS